jgi:hypothetical protein
MDTEELKKQSKENFDNFIDMYVEGLGGRLSRQYLLGQFKHFNDPVGKFIYPYLYDVYGFPEREFPDAAEDESLEDWQMAQVLQYSKDKMSECVQNFAKYMDHCLTLKIYLNYLEVSDD